MKLQSIYAYIQLLLMAYKVNAPILNFVNSMNISYIEEISKNVLMKN